MPGTIRLKILLPYKIFADLQNVREVIADTAEGSFGILPNRLDCMAALIPGILTYKDDERKSNYIAIDEGILVKTGSSIVVSVRNAISGSSLGKLQEAVEKEFRNLDEKEKNVRNVLAKLESGFIHSFEKIRQE